MEIEVLLEATGCWWDVTGWDPEDWEEMERAGGRRGERAGRGGEVDTGGTEDRDGLATRCE